MIKIKIIDFKNSNIFWLLSSYKNKYPNKNNVKIIVPHQNYILIYYFLYNTIYLFF